MMEEEEIAQSSGIMSRTESQLTVFCCFIHILLLVKKAIKHLLILDKQAKLINSDNFRYFSGK